MGNGVCDGVNNIGICEYDGGDCCSGEVPICGYDCDGDNCICHETGEHTCRATNTTPTFGTVICACHIINELTLFTCISKLR